MENFSSQNIEIILFFVNLFHSGKNRKNEQSINLVVQIVTPEYIFYFHSVYAK
jgi:hypothetical protein